MVEDQPNYRTGKLCYQQPGLAQTEAAAREAGQHG